MNTSPEDKDVFTEFEVTSRRPLLRFQLFIWIMLGIQFGAVFLLRPLHLARSIYLTLTIVPTVIMLAGVLAFIWWLAPRHPLARQMRPAARRLVGRPARALLLYIAVFAAVTWIDLHWHPAGAAAIAAALAPTLPILFAIRAMLQFLKDETDEFLRARLLESWAIATGLCLAVCTVWGFLDQFEVVPHLPLWAAFLIWACCLMPANILLQRRDA